MKKRLPVSKIMSSNVVTVNTSQSLNEVEALLNENNIRHIPVVSGKEVIGMISKVDLHKISFVNPLESNQLTTTIYNEFSIEQVMTKNIRVIQKDDTIFEVATILADSEFHSLPVVDGSELVGIITTTDLIKFLIEQY